MLILLSPAKTLSPSAPPTSQSEGTLTKADGLDDATGIVASLKTWTQDELAQRMKLSPALAEKVHRWHQAWQPDSEFAAGWTFQGDAFKSLNLAAASKDVVRRAQSRLRIVHAVYGLLRPLDQYAPVRLEMAQSWSPSSKPRPRQAALAGWHQTHDRGTPTRDVSEPRDVCFDLGLQ